MRTNYDGGKSGEGTYQQIINNIPPHNIYIEAFAGHAGIFRKIRRAPLSILNDIDGKTIEQLTAIIKSDKIEICKDFFQGNLFEKPQRPVVIIRNNDYSVILDRFGSNNESFIFCDPPYPMKTRRDQQTKLYRFDWESDELHEKFLERCKLCKCNLMIASYPNHLYESILSGWYKHEYFSTTRKGAAREVIYMNYPPPVIIHDFTYLGKNYRERQNLKAKIKRHIKRLNKLSAHERTALLSSYIQIYKETCQTLINL